MAFVAGDKARRYLRSLPRHAGADLAALYPDADPQVGGSVRAEGGGERYVER